MELYEAIDAAEADLDRLKAATGDQCVAFSILQTRRLAKRFERDPLYVSFARFGHGMARSFYASSELLDIFERDCGPLPQHPHPNVGVYWSIGRPHPATSTRKRFDAVRGEWYSV
jgi:hypothetical protein